MNMFYSDEPSDVVLSGAVMRQLFKSLGLKKLESRTKLNEEVARMRVKFSQFQVPKENKETQVKSSEDDQDIEEDSDSENESLSKRLALSSPVRALTKNTDLQPRPVDKHTATVAKKRQKWTDDEVETLKKHVKISGEGNWAEIRVASGLLHRTNVNLKDKWRNMKNNEEV